MTESPEPLSGRKAEAARNDRTILEAARAVFMRESSAPISAVAKEAGVGISALYRRYAGKEVLLQTLCANGLRDYIAVAEAALAEEPDAGAAFARFLRGVVDADVHSLTVHLAGTFTPTDELFELSTQANALGVRLLERAQEAGAIREEVDVNDLAMLLEQITAVRLDDPGRTRELRRRYVALHLDALRPGSATEPVPGSPPTADELGRRWIPR